MAEHDSTALVAVESDFKPEVEWWSLEDVGIRPIRAQTSEDSIVWLTADDARFLGFTEEQIDQARLLLRTLQI